METTEPTYRLLGITATGPFSGIRFIYKWKKDQSRIVNRLKESFGITGDSDEMKDWKATQTPTDLILQEKNKKILLTINCSKYKKDDRFFGLSKMCDFSYELDEEGVAVEWSANFIAILVEGDENKEWLMEIYNAILNKDVAVYVFKGKNNFYAPAGIELAIYSRYHPESK